MFLATVEEKLVKSISTIQQHMICIFE